MSLTCELGVVVGTLVHIFSSMKHPGDEGDGISGPKKSDRSQIALAFASLATTFLTFTINMIGIGNTLRAARKAVARISAAAQNLRMRASIVQSRITVARPQTCQGCQTYVSRSTVVPLVASQSRKEQVVADEASKMESSDVIDTDFSCTEQPMRT